MRVQSERWRRCLEAWHSGIASGNWILMGGQGEPPPSPASARGWRIEAMEGDSDSGELSCIARDGEGNEWFIGVVDGWCTAVPMPPRVLTDEEKAR